MNRKIVLVVGGSRGIGLAIADHLSDKGYQVHIGARTTPLRRSDLPFHAVDATDLSSVQSVLSDVKPCHVVTTCADVIRANIGDLSSEQARHAFDAKFWAQANVALAFARLGPQEGSLTLTSGIASQATFSKVGIGGVINAALERLVKDIAAIGNIRANCISPGMVWSPAEDGGHQRSAQTENQLQMSLPGGYQPKTSDVALATELLIANKAINGITITLDGGHLCVPLAGTN
ncbi:MULTISPECIES: SDR family oxidoreductase [Xanthomonas]|nr:MULTISPECIES: SDR family oxidoreductase [Xanthomonas]MBO9719159.1 SDR family oxidoreductase [Xanthomonas phaseoli pv. manihotis]MBZ2418866.1 SDR family oxidoreductase [Xanthomonas perforans]MBZ2436020.1 SDR family oxidoreductase [Xanthomonas perforans]MBZ2439341.1 SDR family oxidoreductase [Xanthomonas perforans]MBZ2444218.1 SDR family oxidoreductase [Xanthomonas perforans]